MKDGAPSIGQRVAEIDTPALVVDLDAMARNIATLAGYARRHGLRLRPHAKTHKSAWIAGLQIEAGAVGVCVQKTSEAEALVDGGVGNVLITNEVIDAAKLTRVAALARRCALAIAVDSEAGIDGLAAALRTAGSDLEIFVEIDVGQGRCGALASRAGVLARRVVDAGLRFAGLQAYHGRAQHLRSSAEREAAIGQAAACVREALAAIAAHGLDCPLVTGAGTGSFVNEAASGLWGELQPGSYVFLDRDYADNAPSVGAPVFEHALFVKSQVISRADDRAIVDAGHKCHAIDSGLPGVWGRADLAFGNGGDEHGILRARDASALLPALGEAVWLLPGHCDPTVNLHDALVGLRGGLAHGHVERLIRVDARGCLS
ncbi:MAG: DSD1 family PLP-dependent enzyme [Pseudomonadota bacterium]